MYELYDPCTTMFFFRNKHMMCDFGTGNNNKLNWVLEDKQEMIDIIETIYRGAKKGRGLVVSPKGKLISLLYICIMLISYQITRPGTATKRLIRVECRVALKIVEIGVIRVYRKSDKAEGFWKVGLNISYFTRI
jgi:hypothetical protein